MANTPVFTDTDLNSASDMQVRDMLFERGLHIPLTEDNKLIRKHAIRLLMDWRQDHASMNENARKCRVIFHTSSNPSAGPYVYASVNSKNFQAPYGKAVVVPEYMLRECIDRAYTTSYQTQQDEFGRQSTVEVHIPTYPYTFLGYVEEQVDGTEEVVPTPEQVGKMEADALDVQLVMPVKRGPGRPRKNSVNV